MNFICARCARPFVARTDDDVHVRDDLSVVCRACEFTERLIEPGTIVEYIGPMRRCRGLWVVKRIDDSTGNYVLARGEVHLVTSVRHIVKGAPDS